MAIPNDYTREARRIRVARRVVLALAVPVLALALAVRLRPELGSSRFARGGPEESGRAVERPGARSDSPPGVASLRFADVPAAFPQDTSLEGRDTARATGPGAGAITPADPAHRAPRRARRGRRGRPTVVTDVVLLPCSMQNPRPDGAFVIPPHDPRHRTIVGLPSGPGEPKQGFVIPPHDPREENRIAIEVVPMDSILAASLRVPPHDPDSFNVVRRDTVPCR